MNEFPRSVFRSPGKKDCQGGSFCSIIVNNPDEFADMIQKGWAATLPEALNGPSVKPVTTNNMTVTANNVTVTKKDDVVKPKPKRKYTRRVKNVD
ncbi:hypothetical protein N9917_02395 [Deltaproteobacteria bacterium]|nr:hypothetical protein [Deltaproteobacteria bacterium]